MIFTSFTSEKVLTRSVTDVPTSPRIMETTSRYVFPLTDWPSTARISCPCVSPALIAGPQGMGRPDKQAGRIADAFGSEMQRDADDSRRRQHGVRHVAVGIVLLGRPLLRMTLYRGHQQEGKQDDKQHTTLEGPSN